MELIDVFLIMLLFMAALFGTEVLLRKRLNVKKASLADTPAKRVDQWGRAVLTIAAICFIPFIIGSSMQTFIWFLVLFLMILQSFQAFLQWKYIKESREHILTLLQLIVTVCALLVFSFLVYS